MKLTVGAICLLTTPLIERSDIGSCRVHEGIEGVLYGNTLRVGIFYSSIAGLALVIKGATVLGLVSKNISNC